MQVTRFGWSDIHILDKINSTSTAVDVSREPTGLNEVNSTGGAVEVARWSYCKPACQVEKLPITVRGNLRPDWTCERSTRHPFWPFNLPQPKTGQHEVQPYFYIHKYS